MLVIFSAASWTDSNTVEVRMFRLFFCLSLVPFCLFMLMCTTEARHNTAVLHKQIELLAKITVVQIKDIKQKFPLNSQILLVLPGSPPIQGLASLRLHLGHLEHQIHTSGSDALDQIQANLSTLRGHVEVLALVLGCPEGAQGPEDAPSRWPLGNFGETRSYESLEEVQNYMEKMTQHMDKLSVC